MSNISYTRKELRAGNTFYVINVDNEIEAYYVIKRKGERWAMVTEFGPVPPRTASIVLDQCTKFRSLRRAKSVLKYL